MTLGEAKPTIAAKDPIVHETTPYAKDHRQACQAKASQKGFRCRKTQMNPTILL
jgi:hypothetical protein